MKLQHPTKPVSVDARVMGYPGDDLDPAQVGLDLCDSKSGYVTPAGLANVFSNVTPAGARQLALALLREAARAEGRPLPAPADAVVSHEWREVSRALREEAAR